MPPDVVVPRERPISHTKEWELISELRRYGPQLNRPRGLARRSTRTQELRNAINGLDLQVRRTFTTLELGLLLCLESEAEDELSESSSDSEMDTWDGVYDSSANLPSSSIEGALFHLRRICLVLEARVSPLVIPVIPQDSDPTRAYPRLTRLVDHLESILDSDDDIEFIPSPKCTPARFLFNIAKDQKNVDAFITFCDPTQKRPHKEARKRMTAEARSLENDFFSFNSFFDKLKPSLDNLSARPLNSPPQKEFFVLLQRFQQQTAIACQTIRSQFGHCHKHESVKHKVLLQLPGWKDVSNEHTPDLEKRPSFQLFFTLCSRTAWKHARMYCLEPEHSGNLKQQRLCSALGNSYRDGSDLEFYVSDHNESTEDSFIPIRTPIRPKRTRHYGNNCPDDEKSLWDLIKEDYFAKTRTFSFNLTTKGSGILASFDQRNALAAKLIIGLMLSINTRCVLECWKPEHIYFLKSVGAYETPFVHLHAETRNLSSNESPLLDHLDGLLQDGGILPPQPVFLLLAKTLIQIAFGESLDKHVFSRESEDDLWESWQSFREHVDEHTEDATCGYDVNLEAFPFLRAAQGCLNFHSEYQINAMGSEPNQRMGIAWRIIFEKILGEIDVDLKNLIATPISGTSQLGHPEVPATRPYSTIQAPSPSDILDSTANQGIQIRGPGYTVSYAELFDATQTTNHSAYKARDFWERLDRFHWSYSQTVRARDTLVRGTEPPRRIRIAVLDTGVDFNHPLIANAMDSGRVNKDWCHSWVGGDVSDDDNGLHGTNCAYLLHKAAPEADIYIAKVFKENVMKFYQAENIAKAIKYATETWDVDIISMSFGLRLPQAQGDKEKDDSMRHDYYQIIDDIQTAIENASINPPRLMFAAASNNGKNDPRAFPARQSHVFSVHASDGLGEDGGINPMTEDGLNFMTLGMDLELIERELVSKGGKVIPKYKSVVKSGTSFATPIAAGIAATVLDLGARVECFDERTRKKLRRREGMEKVLRLMSKAENNSSDRLHYMAPWRFWDNGWELEDDGRAKYYRIKEMLRV